MRGFVATEHIGIHSLMCLLRSCFILLQNFHELAMLTCMIYEAGLRRQHTLDRKHSMVTLHVLRKCFEVGNFGFELEF